MNKRVKLFIIGLECIFLGMFMYIITNMLTMPDTAMIIFALILILFVILIFIPFLWKQIKSI